MLQIDRSSLIRRRLPGIERESAFVEPMLSSYAGKLPLADFGAGLLARLGWQLVAA